MPIIVDLIMIGLLIGVIIYTTRLSISLQNFKSLHAEITPLLRDHTSTISNSMKSMAELRRLSEDVNHKIIIQSREYATVKSDLQFLYDRALTACDRLERLIEKERNLNFGSTRFVQEDQESEFVERGIKLRAEPKSELNDLSPEKPVIPLETFSMKKTAGKLLRKQREKTHAA